MQTEAHTRWQFVIFENVIGQYYAKLQVLLLLYLKHNTSFFSQDRPVVSNNTMNTGEPLALVGT